MTVEKVGEGQILYLGTVLLKERLVETQTLIRSLDNEEIELKARLGHIRRTKTFLKRDYLKLWRRIVDETRKARE